jgi:hypothetical protein
MITKRFQSKKKIKSLKSNCILIFHLNKREITFKVIRPKKKKYKKTIDFDLILTNN